MIRPATFHVWTKTVTTSPPNLPGTVREAVDLRPPDPRTGIW